MATEAAAARARPRLAEVLLAEGLVRADRLQAVLARRNGRGAGLGRTLVDEGALSEEDLARAYSLLHALPTVDLAGVIPDPALLDRFPPESMLKGPFLPFARVGGRAQVAVADPGDLFLLDRIRETLGPEVDLHVAPRPAILRALRGVETSQPILRDLAADFMPAVLPEADEADQITLEKLKGDDSPVIRLVDSIILNALERRASDIHLEAQDNALQVKYRVDGLLSPALEPIGKPFHDPILSRIKVMAELDIAERRIPQDGRFKANVQGRAIDFRVSILPSAAGESAVIRILDKEAITKELAELRLDLLGFAPEDLASLRRASLRPHGMVLVTGPTGSGKTTTLYAALSEINTGQDKIITIEDPIEYRLRNVVQVPVNEKKGLTFARGLRSILRHDPDRILVGEIRDAETAQIAVQAALTGHLVFTTVHANNIIDVIGRFTHMGLEPYNFVSALNHVLTQRLVRTICPGCRAPARPDPEDLAAAGLDPAALGGRRVYAGAGCAACNGAGFKGRTVVGELVEMNDTIRELIVARRPASEIRAAAKAAGTVFLREVALGKAFDGVTTLAEANRVTAAEG
jgi:type IV pilus assembly protein PilB